MLYRVTTYFFYELLFDKNHWIFTISMMHIQQLLRNFLDSSLSEADYNNSSFYTELCMGNMEWDIFNCVFLCSIG